MPPRARSRRPDTEPPDDGDDPFASSTRGRDQRIAEEDEIDEAESARDYTIARLAAARSSSQASIDAIDEAIALFMSPDEDKKGKKRVDLIDEALEASGYTSRALELASRGIDDIDPELGEPDEEDDEDEDGDDD